MLVGRAYRVDFVSVLLSIFPVRGAHLRFVAVVETVELWWMAIDGAGSMYVFEHE